jgi:hypothetical protein
MWLPGWTPLAARPTGSYPIDGKAQVTREPTGHPAADGAWGPQGPPRPRPSRAGSGPFPGAATGPMPRRPASHGQPDDDPWSGTAPGFEFERRRPRPSRARSALAPEPSSIASPKPTHGIPPGQPGHARPPRPSAPSGPPPGPSGPPPGPAGAEWARLLRSLLPQPVKRRWSREFLAGLEFRGWGIKVAIPILAMVVFGVAVVVIADANSGHGGPAPSAASLGFPPATLAGHDFTAAASARGITQTLGRMTSVGDQIVAVGSQSGARIARAQFFVSGDGGRTWTMGAVKSAAGGVPPPGHAAIFVAGGQGAWVALGPGSIWTSPDGKTWTLAPGTGMPLRPGDRINAVTRTAHGFIAVGANVPGGQAARSTPLIFLSADGIAWERLDAARLRLTAAGARVLDLRYVAAAGQLILIGGDVVTTRVTGQPKRTVTVRAGAAWLTGDGGATWTSTSGGLGGEGRAGAGGHGAQPQLAGVAAAGHGFVLLRPATVARRPAVDAFYSPNCLAWTFRVTLSAATGFTALMANGGPDGVAVTGRAGRNLTAFASADGQTWHKVRAFGTAASEDVSGVALAPDGAVITAGVGDTPDGRQPVLALTGLNAAAQRVDIAKIPGAVELQVAVNSIAAQGSTQVAVGSANGYPAAWTSANGGGTWTRAAGALPAVLSRPGSQRLTSVIHGPMGWLAVGGVMAAAPKHPVVVVSTDGTSWQAADGERVFGTPGLFTEQAAANARGYVIIGHQDIEQVRAGNGPGNEQGRVVSDRTEAAVWWSAALAGWHRAGDATAGALDGTGDRQMTAVTALSISGGSGFVAVGSHGNQPSAWTSADAGRTWRQADLPLPVGSSRAVLQHVASAGRVVVAVGSAVTTDGRSVPFAASSANGGANWAESALPVPAGLTSVTALAAAGGSFTAIGTYGSTPGHQDVVVWTSADGSAWRAAEPAGQGLTGPGIQAITGLAVAGSTLAGVGFTASPGSEQPVFWQSPVR